MSKLCQQEMCLTDRLKNKNMHLEKILVCNLDINISVFFSVQNYTNLATLYG